MASAAPPSVASTKETSNYARLCRLLVDVGSQALRDTFDGIHPPAALHGVLARHPEHATLQSLRKKRILNPTQWGKLYPTTPSAVLSASFDITLLMVLLRNICGLHPPATGWDSLPPPADTSTEANIARVKYYRNTVYGHASQASVDDATFNTYWQDISNALVALGGVSYGVAINKLKNECMDPDMEEHCTELLKQWKKDEDSIKDKLKEIEDKIRNVLQQMRSEIGNISSKLDTLMTQSEETRDEDQARDDFQQMRSEIRNITEKVNTTQISSREIANDEESTKDKREEIRVEIENMNEKLDTFMNRLPVKREPGNHMKDVFDPTEIIDGIRQLYKLREGWLAPFPWCEEFHFHLDNIFTKLKVVSRTKTRGTATTNTVDMSGIFEPHEECLQPRTVLIEGKPGLGKTTYCKKLVYDWATYTQKPHFPKFETVLLLRCRDMKSDLWEAIDDQLLPRDIKEDVRERFFDFIRHNQSNVLLILDGLDEVPANKLPMFSEIIQGRVLLKCRLVATAQPIAGMKVRQHFDTLLKIEGFTDEKVHNFIVKYFKTMEHLAQTLLSKLKNDENLKEMAANPLIAALLCLIWEDFQGVFSDNRAKLFLQMVQHVLMRYRKKEGLPDINYDDLIAVYKTQLKHLGWLALKGLREDNMGFQEHELGSHSADLPRFGFLSVQLGGSKLRPQIRYSFLHKSFQAFFAAFYLCDQLLNEEITANSLVADRIYFYQLKEVIPFVFGMLTVQSQETTVALITSISTKFNQEVKTDGDDLLCVLLECIKECNEEQSKAAVANAVGSTLQLPAQSLASLAELLEQRKGNNEGVIPPEIIVQGRSALEAYRKALTEGKTVDKRVPVMFIGQERSGKTSLMKSLRGEPFNPNEKSTIGIDVGPSYFKVTTEIWKVGKNEKETNSESGVSFEYHAARATVENLKQEETAPDSEDTILDSMQSMDEAAPKDDAVTASANNVTSVPLAVDVTSRSSHSNDVASASSSSSSTQDNSSKETAEVLESLQMSKQPEQVDRIPKGTESMVIKIMKNDRKDEDDVYFVLWDFAGQSVYYTTHPLFLTPRAIYLLEYDLSRNPYEKAPVDEKQGIYEKLKDSFDCKTNLDCLEFWMSSVASLASQQESDQVSTELKKSPTVFLVFTHADAPYDGSCAPYELARKIYGPLKKTYETLLYKDFFIVDNTKSGSESQCPEVVSLRKEVLAVSKELPQMKEAIPIKWLDFEKKLQAMRKRGEKWITLEKAKTFASDNCNIIDDKEFRTLLNFLHDKRILIHFDDTQELDKLVILDPQWLIDVFKKVITVKPHDPEEENFKELWGKLQECGILEEKLLEHVWGPLFDSKETSESLIAIMEKFSLLCTMPSSDDSCSKQYLVPSMLMSHPREDIMELKKSCQILSLFLKFEPSDHVPPGLFPRLMLQFFQWEKGKFVQQVNSAFHHNFAEFNTCEEKCCSVILLSHPFSIEVVVHRDDTFCMTCACTVRRQLESMLESMRKEFFWLKNMSYKVKFICPVCCKGDAYYYCRKHGTKGCKQDRCLHFLSESELCNAKSIRCSKRRSVAQNTVSIERIAPWLISSNNQLKVEQRGGRDLASVEGVKRKRKLTSVSRNKRFKPISGTSKDSQGVKRKSLSSESLSSASRPKCSKPISRTSMDSPVTFKKGKPEDDDLEGLAKEIPNEWRDLGRRLLDHSVVEGIRLLNESPCEKAYNMLMKWKQSKGSSATFRVLYHALCHKFVNRKDLAERYCCVGSD